MIPSIPTPLPTFAHAKTVRADDVVRHLAPVPSAGQPCLAVPSRVRPGDSESVYQPLAGPAMQFAGRIGQKALPQTLFTVVNNQATANPVFVVWPFSVPMLAGSSIADRPVIQVADGLNVYMRAKFSEPSPGVVHSSEVELFTDRRSDLTTGLKLEADAVTIQIIGSFAKNERGALQFIWAQNISELPYLPS